MHKRLDHYKGAQIICTDDNHQSNAKKTKVATSTRAKLLEIAQTKLPDLNAYTVEEAMKIVEGTARNMGIKVTE